MNNNSYDVIIVGTGAAGLFHALSLPKNTRILMITKDRMDISDSYLAQGGISALLNEEDYDNYYEDTMRAGHYKNNPNAVKTMIQSSRAIIKDLIHYGVSFDRKKDGSISYTREGGHSAFRILHSQDTTGKEIVTKLLERVKEQNNIEIKEFSTMVDFIETANTCHGIVVRNIDKSILCYYAKSVVLATGGIGGLFSNSTNFSLITGDSFALALRHNVLLEDLNYIQIHPTVLYSKKTGRRFLISESVRGEGAILLNEKKERFIDELLPRDVVTKAIRGEMKQFGTDHVYLSFQHIKKEEILSHFPAIYTRCLEEGYDVTKECIPVTPAQHYLMGGIQTNTFGETSMKHLFAIGETACNGVHGANRLASNSLLESLVFAKQAAFRIAKELPTKEITYTLPDFSLYHDFEKWNEENKELILQEIKRKDIDFYDEWCHV